MYRTTRSLAHCVILVCCFAGLFVQAAKPKIIDTDAARRPQASTVDSHWAVMKWYSEVYKFPGGFGRSSYEKSVPIARLGVVAAEKMIFSNWCQAQSRTYSFLRYGEDRLGVNQISAEGETTARLDQAIAALGAPIAIRPDKDTCRKNGFAGMKDMESGVGFGAWVDRGGYALGGTYDQNRQMVVASLRTIRTRVVERAFTPIQGFYASGEYLKVIEESDRLIARFGSSAIPRDVSGKVIAAAQQLVHRGLLGIQPTDPGALEALNGLRSKWKGHTAYRVAFEQPEPTAKFAALQKAVGAHVGKSWTSEMSALADKNKPWQMHLVMVKKVEETKALEAAVAEGIRQPLWDTYFARLPGMIEYLKGQARSEIDGGLRHGLATIYYEMVAEIEAYVGRQKQTIPKEVADAIAAVLPLRDASQGFVKDVVSRKLVISDFDPKGNEGTEFKRALDAELAGVLNQKGAIWGVSLSDDASALTPNDYHVVKGIYSAVRAGASPATRTTRVENMKGEVVSVPNPAYVALVNKGRKTDGVSAELKKQRNYAYAVETQTTEMLATGRTRFWIEHANKQLPHAIDLQNKVRRSFTQESLNPPTATITEVSVPSSTRITTGVPSPRLRQDRILSTLEMEEVARTEVRKLAIVHLVDQLARFPLELKAEAASQASKGEKSVAADLLGICFVYANALSLDGVDAAALFKDTSGESYNQEALQAYKKTLADLRALSTSIRQEALDAAGVLLR